MMELVFIFGTMSFLVFSFHEYYNAPYRGVSEFTALISIVSVFTYIISFINVSLFSVLGIFISGLIVLMLLTVLWVNRLFMQKAPFA